MSEEIKFTQEEMQEIADLQSNYQQKIFQLGQIRLDEISIEDAKKNLETRQEEVMTEWKEIQKTENELVNKLAGKYGNGSLNLKDGTFTPAPPDQQTSDGPTDVTPIPTSSDTGNVGYGTSSSSGTSNTPLSGAVDSPIVG